MTSWGLPRNATGQGTTSEQMQRIIASLFEYREKSPGVITRSGILAGMSITTRADWKYVLNDGAYVIDTGANLAAIAAVTAVTLTPPAATSVTTYHTIYLKQYDPAADGGQNHVTIGVVAGTEAPVGTFRIETRVVPANATSTNETYTSNIYGGRDFATLKGASQGLMATSIYQGRGGAEPRTLQRRGDVEIYCTTDRDIELRLQSCITTATWNSEKGFQGSVYYKFYWDDGYQSAEFERPFSRYSNTEEMSVILNGMPQGHHQFWYTVEIAAGDSVDYMVNWSPGGYKGEWFQVFDRGAAT